jgi:hypothetical protein
MRKYLGVIVSILLWASGTGLVLITLSGPTLSKALIISVTTLVILIIAAIFNIAIDE